MAFGTNNLSFGFAADRPVLRGVTAEFPAGHLTAIIGPNGAGKSTLLRLLLGALSPAQGGVTFAGRPVAAYSRRELASRVAYVPQRGEVAFPFSVREVVRLGRYAAGADDRGPVEAALTAGMLTDRRDDPFGSLSAGQQQRVMMARATAQLDGRPGTALLADEPVSAMDPAFAVRTMEQLRTQAGPDRAVIVVLHDLHLVSAFATRVVALGPNGSILEQGPAANVLVPEALERVFGVPFRSLGDPGGDASILVPKLGAYR